MSENNYPDFVFPDVEAGEFVLWMSSPSDEQSHPMLVLKTGDNSLEGTKYSRNDPGHPGEEKSGVRHVADPWLEDATNREGNQTDENGCFIELPGKLRMKRQIANLEAAVAARDEVLLAITEHLNADKAEKDRPVPDLRELVAKHAAAAEPKQPKRRGRSVLNKEPTAPVRGARLSELIGG